MATYETNLKITRFQGLRLMAPQMDLTGSGQIAARSLKNVELKFSENGANVGISSMKGRQKVAELEGKTLIGQWESVQLGVSYWIVYAIDSSGGYLYEYKPSSGAFQLLYEGLSAAPRANGLTMNVGFDDVFVFTNGTDDYLSLNMTADPKVQRLYATDAEGRDIRGLCLKVHDGRLVTNSGNRIHWSKTADIYDWSSSETNVVTSPAYQEFDRDVTAIETYGNALIVWTDTYSVQFTGNPGDASSFQRSEATGGGCAGYQSVIKFDNKLFYYDPKAKNIFAYYLYDTGQIRTSDGLGNNILKYWRNIDTNRLDELKFVAYVETDRSEIWCQAPMTDTDVILILDYLKQEWIVREMGPTTALSVINNKLYCCKDSGLYAENTSDTLDGALYESSYACHMIDLGSSSNLKIPKMPFVITFDDTSVNNFSLEIMIDEDPLKTIVKRIEKQSDIYLIWANEDGTVGGEWAEDDGTGGYLWFFEDALNNATNVYGFIPFKQMRLRFYTEKSGDAFGIKSIEMKRVKIKTKMLA